jgi:hypothetical protein
MKEDPMKEDVKKKLLPALREGVGVVTCIQPCHILRGVWFGCVGVVVWTPSS